MDATTLLLLQHDQMKSLFRQFDAAGGRAKERRAILSALKAELAAHTFLEEEMFYPAVLRLRIDDAKETVREALEEHYLMECLVTELDSLEPEDSDYGDKVADLQRSLERHMRQEEEGMFAQARVHLTDERLDKLGRQMAARIDSIAQVAALGSLPALQRAPASRV